VTDEAEFFGPQWAERVRVAVDDGPDERARAAKLPAYWEWIGAARAEYTQSWALGVPDLPGRDGPVYLWLDWAGGRCHRAAIIGPGAPPDADYVLSAPYAVWRDLLGGADPGRAVMYRELRLVSGNVLGFFRGIYFFVESLATLARVPTRLPA